jgi:hypothetical protein
MDNWILYRKLKKARAELISIKTRNDNIQAFKKATQNYKDAKGNVERHILLLQWKSRANSAGVSGLLLATVFRKCLLSEYALPPAYSSCFPRTPILIPRHTPAAETSSGRLAFLAS